MSAPGDSSAGSEKAASAAAPAAESFDYDVFLSYSRRDLAAARALEKSLRAYLPPAETDPARRRLRVFRDESDLTGAAYRAAITRCLERSKKLLLLCSPDAAASAFVDEEVRLFAKLRGADNIVPLLLRGKPNNEVAADDSQRAFPPTLTALLDLPLALEYRGAQPRFGRLGRQPEASWFGLLARVYDASRDKIERRERRRQSRQRLAWSVGLGAVALALAVLAVWALISRQEAIRQARIAAAGELAARAAGLKAPQQETAELKALLAAEALARFENLGVVRQDVRNLLADALARLPLPLATFAPPAERPEQHQVIFSGDGQALWRAAGQRVERWRLEPLRRDRELELPAPATAIFAAPDQDVVAVQDQRGRLTLFSLAAGSPAPLGELPAARCLAWNADRSRLAVLTPTEARLLSWPELAERQVFPLPPGATVGNGEAGERRREACLEFGPRPATPFEPELLLVRFLLPAAAEGEAPRRGTVAFRLAVDPGWGGLPLPGPPSHAWLGGEFLRFGPDGLSVAGESFSWVGSGWESRPRGPAQRPRGLGQAAAPALPPVLRVSPEGDSYLTARSLGEDPYVSGLDSFELEIRAADDDSKRGEAPGGGSSFFDFTADGRALVTQHGRLLRWWSVSSGAETFRLLAAGVPTAFHESPGGAFVALPRADHAIELWDLRHPQELLRLPGGGPAAPAPDGRRLVQAQPGALLVAGGDGALRIPYAGQPASLRFSGDGSRLAAVYRNILDFTVPARRSRAEVFDLAQPGRRLFAAEEVHDLALAPDGRSCALATEAGVLSVFSLPADPAQEPKLLWRSEEKDPFRRLAFSADGRLLLATIPPSSHPVMEARERPLAVLEAATGKVLLRLELEAEQAVLDRDGRFLAWAPEQGPPQVLSLAAPAERVTLPTPPLLEAARQLRFAPGGRLAAIFARQASTFIGARYVLESAARTYGLPSPLAGEPALLARLPPADDGPREERGTLFEEDRPFFEQPLLSEAGTHFGATVHPSRRTYWQIDASFTGADAVVWDLAPATPVEVFRQPGAALAELTANGSHALLKKHGQLGLWRLAAAGDPGILCRRVRRTLTAEERESYLGGEEPVFACPPPASP